MQGITHRTAACRNVQTPGQVTAPIFCSFVLSPLPPYLLSPQQSIFIPSLVRGWFHLVPSSFLQAKREKKKKKKKKKNKQKKKKKKKKKKQKKKKKKKKDHYHTS
jgi:mannitol-specific phosphotransferase system IIBC component